MDISAPEIENAIFLQESDFYKEMRLRGYFHQKLFKSVKEVRNDGSVGKVQWNNDWMTFMDCMIQFLILRSDSRMLMLPTSVRKVVIDPKLHREIISKPTEEKILLEVVACPYSDIIKSGGIEIHGFEGSFVNRRRPQVNPVLEVQKFVSHCSSLKLSTIDASKFCVQLILENMNAKNFVSVEIDSRDDKKLFSEHIFQALEDLPAITPKINFLTTKEVEIDGVDVADKELSSFNNVNLIIKSNCTFDIEFLEVARSALNENGFIISREPADDKNLKKFPNSFQLIAKFSIENENLLLIRFDKREDSKKETEQIIRVTLNLNQWLEPLKTALKAGKSVLVYSQNEPLSGLLGFVNCIRRELNGEELCVFIDDPKAPTFDVNDPFYESQLDLGLAVNVLKNGQWGSYKHLLIKQLNEKIPRIGHFFVNTLVRGDLSTLKWLEGPITEDSPNVIRIQYASLNFRDVMVATGKINLDHLFHRIEAQQSTLGFEYSGVDMKGRRMMGIGHIGNLSTCLQPNNHPPFEVPANWTLEEAATVPTAYFTVYLALFGETKIESGKSILIHSGSGAVGTAAIEVATAYGLKVYTTVGTDKKKKYLMERFPNLNPSHIGNSRDLTFEQMVQVGSKGKGVDFVLNSLSDDKLQASIRCLGNQGTFLEIGKFDIINKTNIHMGHLAKQIVFKAVYVSDSTESFKKSEVRILIIKNFISVSDTSPTGSLPTSV